MARHRQTIDPRANHMGKRGGIKITGDKLIVDIDEAAIAADLAAANALSIAEQMRASGKWVNTGTLVTGLTVVRGSDGRSATVTAPPDRLQRPELVDKLAEDIAAVRDPSTDRRVAAAIEIAGDSITKVQRGG